MSSLVGVRCRFLAVLVLVAVGLGCGDASVPSPSVPTAWTIVETPDGQQLLQSDDLGSTWRARFDSASGPISDVDFSDRRNGWMVGGARIWRTSDGGLTWESQAIAALREGFVLSLQHIRFFDAEHGFAIGDEMSSSGGRPFGGYRRGLVTDDGGATWRSAESSLAPGFGKPCTGRELDAFLPSVRLGDFTADGGVSWSAIPEPPATFLAIVATCDRGGGLWALGTARPDPLADRRLALLRSTDRGATWVDRTAAIEEFVRPSRSLPDANERVLPEDLAFLADGNGWMLLRDVSDEAAYRHLLLRTDDLGETWDQLPDPPYPTVSVSGFTTLSVASPTVVALSGAICIADDDGCFPLALSTDGGVSFAAVDLRPVAGGVVSRVGRLDFSDSETDGPSRSNP
jgi:hypothetical protein